MNDTNTPSFETQYLAIMKEIIEKGFSHPDRTGTGRRSLTSRMIKINLKDEFPAVTTQRVFLRGAFEELKWMITGNYDTKDLQNKGVRFWDAWATNDESVAKAREEVRREGSFNDIETLENPAFYVPNSIGPMYGQVWRGEVSGVDQLENIINGLKENPYSSRHIMSSYDPRYLPNDKIGPQANVMLGKGALYPCHGIHTQFQVEPTKDKIGKDTLHCTFTCRSQDFPVGTTINIAFYAMLTHFLAHDCGFEVGELTWIGVDVHIYENQLELAKEQVKRIPFKAPKLKINRDSCFSKLEPLLIYLNIEYEDIDIIDYQHHPHIKYPVSV